MPASRSSSCNFRVEQARRAAGLAVHTDYRLAKAPAEAAPPKASAASAAQVLAPSEGVQPPDFDAFRNYGQQRPQCKASPTSRAEADAAAAKSAALNVPRAVEKSGCLPPNAKTSATPAAPPPKSVGQQQGEAQAPDPE